LKDFVNCDDDILTTAKIIAEEISSATDKTELQSVEKSIRNHQFLHLGREFPSLSLPEGTCACSDFLPA
jgi:hypothetical protein